MRMRERGRMRGEGEGQVWGRGLKVKGWERARMARVSG